MINAINPLTINIVTAFSYNTERSKYSVGADVPNLKRNSGASVNDEETERVQHTLTLDD